MMVLGDRVILFLVVGPLDGFGGVSLDIWVDVFLLGAWLLVGFIFECLATFHLKIKDSQPKMRTESILEANHKLNPGSNKVVYLDTFASKDVSDCDLFQSKIQHNSSVTNFQPPTSTPNMSLFSRSLVSFEDLQELLLARKRTLLEELTRMKNVNKVIKQESGVWRRREVEFRRTCQERGLLGEPSGQTLQDIQVQMAIHDAKQYLKSKSTN